MALQEQRRGLASPGRVRIVCEYFRITRSMQFRSVHLPFQDVERIQTIQVIHQNQPISDDRYRPVIQGVGAVVILLVGMTGSVLDRSAAPILERH